MEENNEVRELVPVVEAETPTLSLPTPKKMKYKQKYNISWEKMDDYGFWLCASKKGNRFAYCKICNRELLISNSGKTGVEKHAQGKKHIQRMTKVVEQSRLLGLPLESLRCVTPVDTSGPEDLSASAHNDTEPLDLDEDDSYGMNSSSINSRGQNKRSAPYTVICQTDEDRPRNSRTTAEALDNVADALKQVATAIQAIASWLPDQR